MKVCYRLADLAEIGRGSSPRPITDQRYFENGNIPWIKIADATASGKYIYETKEHVNEYGASFSRKLKPESLIIAASGTLGFPKFLGVEGCIHDGWMYFSDIDESLITKDYLYYYLITLTGYFNNLSYGAAIQNINTPIVKKTKVFLPPLDVQAKISNALASYDELIENNNKRIKLLEQMAENLYKEWFARFRFPGYENAEFDNGIPKGWEIYQAQNLFDITIGRTPDRKQFDYFTTNKDDALWVSISDMKDNMFVTKSSEYLTDEAIKKVNMPMVEEDTVLLSFKLSVGRVSITTKQSCTNEAIAHFKTNDKELLEYTYLYLKLFNYQNLGNTSAIGNAVNSTIIKKMKFLLPNRELIQEFHNCTKDIFAQIKNVMNENENLIKQRDLLLPRLMSGKLEV